MKIKEIFIIYLSISIGALTGCNVQEKTSQDITVQVTEEKTIVKDGDGIGANKALISQKPDAEKNVILNQLGYLPNDIKKVVFRGEKVGKKFSVISINTNEIVYTGEVGNKIYSPAADETNYIGDFSEVTKEGVYKIITDTSGESYQFRIGQGIYKEAFEDALRFFYLQRCGQDIPKEYGDTWAHQACHTEMATIYGSDKKIDVSRGWHDAGDYGRYVIATSKAVTDLLLAYETNKEAFDDNLNIPESGNGIPDVLDEVRYQLVWLLKMQNQENGGVYHKVTGANFPGYIMPQLEISDLIVCPISTTATGDFAAVMAMGHEAYKEIDSELADECLKAAQKAWVYLEQAPNSNFKNPTGILTGEYGDSNDLDERLWAAVELFKVTNDEKYHDKIKGIVKDINRLDCRYGWQGVAEYAIDTYINLPNADDGVLQVLKENLKMTGDFFLSAAKQDGYNVYNKEDIYYWGSNMNVLSLALLYAHASEIFDEQEYIEYANEQINYCFGKNPMDMSYVTGYGTVYPKFPHHRPSVAQEKTIPGMIVGGPNTGREDNIAKQDLEAAPATKCYIDNRESYSTNEVDIYWNSTLIYALAKLGRV